jgi:hypothetical protein
MPKEGGNLFHYWFCLPSCSKLPLQCLDNKLLMCLILISNKTANKHLDIVKSWWKFRVNFNLTYLQGICRFSKYDSTKSFNCLLNNVPPLERTMSRFSSISHVMPRDLKHIWEDDSGADGWSASGAEVGKLLAWDRLNLSK